MTEEASITEEDLKRIWYNRWKEGFEWLTMARTLRTTAEIIHNAFLAADERFLRNAKENAEVKKEGNTIYIKSNAPSGGPDPEMDLYRVYMGQIGYAIENLLKGIIISGMWLENPQSVDGVDDFDKLIFPLKKGSTTPKMHIKIHELVNLLLAKNMNLTFGTNEKEIMKKLSHFIKWGGRYPSPVKFDEKDEPTFMKILARIDEPEEYEVINKIYRAAERELIKIASLQRDRRD